MVFGDREEAGQRLAAEVEKVAKGAVVVLGIPRGGVVVAKQVAGRLGARLGVVVTKKIGAPNQEELAVGAMDPGGGIVWDERLLASLGLEVEDLREQIENSKLKIQNYNSKFKTTDIDLTGKTAIVVDDGIATGQTMTAAVRYLRSMIHKPRSIIVAVPVGASDSVAAMRAEADQVICLYATPDFGAVGQFYESFPQVTDEQALDILKA